MGADDEEMSNQAVDGADQDQPEEPKEAGEDAAEEAGAEAADVGGEEVACFKGGCFESGYEETSC